LASDVAKEFGINKLCSNVQSDKNDYSVNIDYVYFIRTLDYSSGRRTQKKRLFMTYEGMIKILYSSRSPKARTFRTWATETLFTVQMGTQEQKEDLVSGVLGIPAKSLKQVLSTSVKSVPCIYRFALGKCKDLKKIMKISKEVPDDYVIIKYGYTDNLVRRTNEHIKTYNKIKGVKLELINYAYIDPKYLSQAETDIKGYFETIEIPIEYEKFAELVAINPKHERQIINQFKYITGEYSGCVSDLIEKIEKLKNEIVLIKKDHLIELQNEKHEKDIELQKNGDRDE
jgi:hypothetical protein